MLYDHTCPKGQFKFFTVTAKPCSPYCSNDTVYIIELAVLMPFNCLIFEDGVGLNGIQIMGEMAPTHSRQLSNLV